MRKATIPTAAFLACLALAACSRVDEPDPAFDDPRIRPHPSDTTQYPSESNTPSGTMSGSTSPSGSEGF